MTITAIKLDLLKSNPMLDAKKEAEDIMKKVDYEIQTALIKEIKNKVDENLNIDPNNPILLDPQSLVDQKNHLHKIHYLLKRWVHSQAK